MRKDFKVGDKFTLECEITDADPDWVKVRLDGDTYTEAHLIHTDRAGAFKNYQPAPVPLAAGQVFHIVGGDGNTRTVLFADDTTVYWQTGESKYCRYDCPRPMFERWIKTGQIQLVEQQ